MGKMLTYGFIVMMLLTGCNVNEPENIQNSGATDWEQVKGLENVDVRYMLKINSTLYLSSANSFASDSSFGKGAVYKTTDGVSWLKIKSFNKAIGPMTSKGDTLFVLGTDSIYSYLPGEGWKGKYPTPPRLSDPTSDGDMIFLNGKLYAMQIFYPNAAETYRINEDGSYEEVKGLGLGYSFAGAKFIKINQNGKERVFVRPQFGGKGFWEFDGNKFISLTNGLSQQEYDSYNPVNSMTVKNDTLYAGFKFPPVIKVLKNDTWTNYTDTIPNTPYSKDFNPPLKNETTALSFAGERLFAATLCTGVVEWTNGKWVQISKGLKLNDPETGPDGPYIPVIFLEYFNGKLIVAYGLPAYAPYGWPNPKTGVFYHNLL